MEPMAHKLAGLRRVFRVDFNGRDPVLTEVGALNLSRMNANGHLDRGTHTRRGIDFEITGDAFDEGGRTFLRFSHTNPQTPASFLGVLGFEAQQGNHIVVTGRFSVPNAEFAQKLNLPTAQQQEPWVITKP